MEVQHQRQHLDSLQSRLLKEDQMLEGHLMNEKIKDLEEAKNSQYLRIKI